MKINLFRIFAYWLIAMQFGSAQMSIEINGPSSHSPCDKIPIEVIISNTGGEDLTNVSVRINHSNLYQYVPGLLTNAGVAVQRLTDSSGVFIVDEIIACENYRFVVWLDHVCTDQTLLSQIDVQSVGMTTNASSNTLDLTTYGTGLALINVQLFYDTLTNTFQKCFRVINNGQVALDAAKLFVSGQDNMTILNTDQGTFGQNNDTLYLGPTDFELIGNSNLFFEPGEYLDICQSIDLNPCLGEFEIAHGMSVSCGSSVCEFIIASDAKILVLIADPIFVIIPIVDVDADTTCNEGEIRLMLINRRPPGSFAQGSSMYDLVMNVGWSVISGNRRTPPRKEACLDIYEATVSGQNINLIRGGFSGYGLDFSNLGTDPDGPGGLDDIDGNGFYGDIGPLDTAIVILKYRINTNCLTPHCANESFGSRLFLVEADYKNYCGELFERNQYIGQHQYNWGRGFGGFFGLDQFYTDLDQDTLLINLSRSTIGFLENCPTDSAVIRISFPAVVEIEPGAIVLLNNDTILYTMVGNTMVINSHTILVRLRVPIKLHCDSTKAGNGGGVNTACTFCLGSGIPKYRMRVDVTYYCGNECFNVVPLYCVNSPEFHVLCDGAGAGIASEGKLVIDNMTMKRLTYGSKSSANQTKVDPNVDSLNLHDLMTFDTFELAIPFEIRCDANYSNILFKLIQSPLYSGTINNRDTSKMFEFFADTIKLFDGETGTWSSCGSILGAEFYNLQNNGYRNQYISQVNINPLLNSCLTGTLSKADSMVIVVRGRVNDVFNNNVRGALLRGHVYYSQDGCNMDNPGFVRFNVFSGVPSSGRSSITQPYYRDIATKNYYRELSLCTDYTIDANLDGYYGNVYDSFPFPNEFRKPYLIKAIKFVIPPFLEYRPNTFKYIRDFLDYATFRIISDTTFAVPEVSDSLGYTIVEYQDFHMDDNFFSGVHRFTLDVGTACYGFREDTIWVHKTYDYQLQSNDPADHHAGYVKQPIPVTMSGVGADFGNTTVQLLSDSLQVWDLDLFSWTSGYLPDYWFTYHNVWVSLDNPSGGIQIDSLVEILPDSSHIIHTPSFNTAGLRYYLLDTVWIDRKFKLYTKTLQCYKDSINVLSGNNCLSYPDFENLENDVCRFLNDQQTLFYYSEPSQLSAQFIQQPDSAFVTPCDSFNYIVKVTNNGLGHSLRNRFEIYPPDGMNLVTAVFEDFNGIQTTLGPPVVSGNTLTWDLDALIGNNGVSGFYLVDENYYNVRLKFTGNCALEEGAILGARALSRSICGEDNETLKINAIPLEFDDPSMPQMDSLYDLTLTFELDSICSEKVQVNVKLISIDNGSIMPGQKLSFLFKKELSVVDGTVFNNFNVSGSGLIWQSFDDWESIQLPLDNPVGIGDSIKFSFFMEKICLAPCKTTDFAVDINAPTTVGCAFDPQGTCEQLINTQSWVFSDILLSPDIDIIDSEITLERIGGGFEQLNIKYRITNNSAFSAKAEYIISLYYDTDNDGKLSTGDLFIWQNGIDGGQVKPYSDQWVMDSFAIDGAYSCRLIATLDLTDNPCLCLTDTLSLVTPDIIPEKSTFFSCYQQAVDVGFDADVNYNYRWTDSSRLAAFNGSWATYLYDDILVDRQTYSDTLYIEAYKTEGCSVFDTVFVNLYSVEADIAQIQDILCFGDNGGVLLATGIGPYDEWSFEWTGQGVINDTLTDVGPGVYYVRAIDSAGCFSIDSIVVTEPTALLNTMSIDTDYNGYDVSCHGSTDGSVSVNVGGGTPDYTYEWLMRSDTAASIADVGPGWHVVIATDANGCEIIDSILLKEPPPLYVDGYTEPSGCDSEHLGSASAVASGGVPGYEYFWEHGDIGYKVDGLLSGEYKVTVRDLNGCTKDTMLFVDQLPDPVISINILDTTIILGESIVLRTRTNAINPRYLWTPNDSVSCDTCAVITVNPTEDITYLVQVTDENGCQAWAELTIHVRLVKSVWAPNAITPNGDNLNDGFTIYGNIGLETILHLEIYDRWGELLFQKSNFDPNDTNLGWDGTLRGEQMNPAVFVYWARVLFIDGEERILKGDVTLIR